MAADLGREAFGVADRERDLVPGVGEQPPEAVAQQHLVLGDHDPHGSSAVRTVPASAALSRRSRPPWAATRSRRAAEPGPVEARAARAVVAHADDERAVLALGAERHGWSRGRA